jgi:hypothetical protein
LDGGIRLEISNLSRVNSELIKALEEVSAIGGSFSTNDVEAVALGDNNRSCTIISGDNGLG